MDEGPACIKLEFGFMFTNSKEWLQEDSSKLKESSSGCDKKHLSSFILGVVFKEKCDGETSKLMPCSSPLSP
jgi:hypothetical protein